MKNCASCRCCATPTLTVAPFVYRETHDQSARITHRIEITGDDSPGLIARAQRSVPPDGRQHRAS